MKVAVLFSGGKDSCYSAFLAKQKGYEISCLITIISENKYSFMFHTPSISKVKEQAKVMGIPLLTQKTRGVKEKELLDLEKAIVKAKKKFKIQGIVTGALASNYQASRISKICDKLSLECFNPLWQKDQFELLEELINNNFEVVVTGVFAFPLDEKWLLRKIDRQFIIDMRKLHEQYKINPAGEGGEIETFVLNCPLFKKRLKITSKKISGERNSWRADIKIKSV